MKNTIHMMIIGTQKAGTTSLRHYLSQHPEICTNEGVEVMTFVRDDEFEQGYEKMFDRYFSHCSTQKILGKNVDIFNSGIALRRLAEFNSEMLLVLILRNPIDRAYSAFWHARRFGYEPLANFEEALQGDPERFKDDWAKLQCDYLNAGLYYKLINEVYAIFPKNQVKIYLFKEFLTNPSHVCKELFALLDVDDDFPVNVEDVYNPAATPRSGFINQLLISKNPVLNFMKRLLPFGFRVYLRRKIRRFNEREFKKPKMKEETRSYLEEFYKEDIQNLEKLLNVDLQGWLS